MKLKSKLLISLILLIIVPLVTGMSITYFNIRNGINNIDEKKAYSNLDNVSNYLNYIVDSHSKAYVSFTPWDDFYNAIEKKNIGWIKENISSCLKEDTNSEAIIVTNSDGSILSAFNSPSEWANINFKSFNLYKKFKDNTPCVAGLEMTSNGLYIVSMAKVVKNADINFNNCDGYIIYARKIKNSETTNGSLVKGLIEQGKDITGVDITLKLNNGEVLSTSNNSMPVYLKPSDFKYNEIKINKKTLKDSTIIQTEKVLTDAGNKPIGVLSIDTKSKAGIAALNTLLYNTIALVIILILLVIMLCYIIINLNVKPLNMIISEFEKISHGDLTEDGEGTSLQKYANKKDEIGNLARTFNAMKSNLRNTVVNINKSATIVSETSKTLSQIANNTNETANETAVSIDNMALEATRQSDYSLSIYNMMEGTKEYINKGDNELSTAIEGINRARNIVNKSNRSIEEATDYVQIMSESLNKSSDSINELKNHSNEIANITTVIKSISEQTNLLALNAAIEAARAGEQGKGFAVVADEIRKLSEKSSSETKHIEELIKNILSETDSTVKIIENNLNAFGKQVELIKYGANELSAAVENINQTEENSKQVQIVFGTIKTYVNDTFTNVKKITNSITESTQKSEQLSASTQEQLSIITQLTQSANDLSRLANELETEVIKFKV